MARSNTTHTDKSQGSDHEATSPKLITQDTDFRIVAEDAPVVLWLTNAEGKVVFTNSKWKKFVGGASEHAPLASDAWIKALHPDDLEPCMKTFNDSFGQHESFQMEYRLRRADGQCRYVLDTGEPYINKEGKFSGFIGSSTDITDRKNHENQLRLSQFEPLNLPPRRGLAKSAPSWRELTAGIWVFAAAFITLFRPEICVSGKRERRSVAPKAVCVCALAHSENPGMSSHRRRTVRSQSRS